MGFVVEFGFDLVAGAAGSPPAFHLRVPRQWIATLDHEILHDAVERGAVVKPFFGEGLEVFHRPGRYVGPEFNDHFTRRCFDDRDFVHGLSEYEFAGGCYFTESAGTILTLSSPTRFAGLLGSPYLLGPTAVSPILPSTSSPLIRRPKAVY